MEVPIPGDFAAEFSERGLSVGLDEETETGFDCGALGTGAGAAHGLCHEMVVELDVSAHGYV